MVGRMLSVVVGEADPGTIGVVEGADDGYVVGGISGVCGASSIPDDEVDVPVTEVTPDMFCN